MAERPVSLARKVLFYVILILLPLVILELCCRVYYYQRLSAQPLAIVRVIKDFRRSMDGRRQHEADVRRLEAYHRLIRPGSLPADNDTLINETLLSDQGVYEPWVEFAFRDIGGKYVNVTNHVRLSVPDRSDEQAGRPFRIFFLGGSTTYGFNVKDSETIPSCFVRAYQKRYPNGRAIQVFNLGMPFYFSYQELMLLTDKIFRNDTPDMVIMLDGLNDFLQANAAFERAPVFAPGLGGEVAHPGSSDEKAQMPDYYKLPEGISRDSACAVIAGHYLENIRHAHDLTSIYHIPLYCFWQPVPYYNYPNRSKDPISAKSAPPQFEGIYRRVKEQAATIPYLSYFGDLLQGEKGLPFADQIHYSPYFSSVIAEKMLTVITIP